MKGIHLRAERELMKWTEWMRWSRKAIREYLKGKVVHASGGRREGKDGVTFIRAGRSNRKVRQHRERLYRRWDGTKPGQRGEPMPKGYA